MSFSKVSLYWNAFIGFITPGLSVFEKVSDYLLEVGNNMVASLPTAKKAQIETILVAAKTIHGYLVRFASWCPGKWREEYDATVRAFATVIDAVSDLRLTKSEIKEVVSAWKTAYDSWTADDERQQGGDEVPGDVKAVE